jgi:hypothetical protein
VTERSARWYGAPDSVRVAIGYHGHHEGRPAPCHLRQTRKHAKAVCVHPTSRHGVLPIAAALVWPVQAG